MKFRLKKNIFLSVMLLALASFFFYERILLLAVEKILSAYTFSYWGQVLSFDDLSFEEKKIVMIRPSLHSKFSFEAEKIIFSIDFDFWEKKFFLNLDFYKPSWFFENPLAYQKNTLAALVAKDKKGLKFQSHVSIHQGEIAWTFSDEHPKQSMKMEASFNSHSGGFLDCYFNDSQSQISSFLKLKGSNDPEKMLIDCKINSLNCLSFFSLAKLLKIDVFPFECTQGNLNGQLKAFLNVKQRPEIQGELICSGVKFENKALDCRGDFKVVQFLLNKEGHQDPSHIASLKLLEPGFLELKNLKMEQITGALHLSKEGYLVFHLQGDGDFSSDWDLVGRMLLDHRRCMDVSMDLSLKDRSSELHLDISENQEGSKKIDVSLKDLKANHCNTFQDLVCALTNKAPCLLFKKGNFSTDVCFVLEKGGKGNLEIHQLRIDFLNFRSLHSSMDFMCQKVEGTGVMILGEKTPWHSFSGKLHLENSLALFFDDPNVFFESQQADILMDKGSWKTSQVKFNLGQFQGVMDIEWGRKEKSIQVDLSGKFPDLIALCPLSVQNRFKKSPLKDAFKVRWNICRKGEVAEALGTFTLEDPQKPDTLFFKFEKEWDQLFDGKFPLGTFYGKNLCAKKIISPLLFRNGRLEMSGQVEIEGKVDSDAIDLYYNAENLKIESEDLCMYCKNLKDPVAGQFLGFHRLNLMDYSHQGSLAIKEGTYLQKKKELLFEQVQGVAFFKEDTVCFPRIEAFCEEVYFEGALDFDYSDPAPGVFSLKLEIPHFSGKLSQIRRLFLHFDKSSVLHELPIEAQINERKEGMLFSFSFKPDDFDVLADIYASLSEGTFGLGYSNLSLDGIYMNMEYHHSNKELFFKDIQGVLSVGQPEQAEEYLLEGNHLICRNLLNPELVVDFSLKEGKEELARIVAHTQQISEGIKAIYLDKNLSHISSIRPVLWDVAIKDWKEIEKMEFRSSLDFGELCLDLCRFKKTGIGVIHAECIKKLECISKVEGEGILSIRLNPFDRFCYFDLSGHYGDLNSSEVQLVHLKGRKKERKWFLDELRWADWSFYAEFEPGDHKWRIPFFGVSLPQSLLLGMEGEIDLSRSLFKAKINLGELSLNSHLLRNRCFFSEDCPAGFFDFTGEIDWNYNQEDFLEGLKGHLIVENKKIEFSRGELCLKKPFRLEWEVYPHYLIRLKNLEGHCCFENHLLDFYDGGLLYSPSKLLFSGQFLKSFLGCRFSGSVDLPFMRSGTCCLTDGLSQKGGDPLSVNWTRSREGCFFLDSLKGNLFGCLFDFGSKETEKLTGSLQIDLKKMSCFFSEEAKSFFNKIENSFSCLLEGVFSFKGGFGKKWTEMFSFGGRLSSDCLGVSSLEAKVDYHSGYLFVRDLEFRENEVLATLESLSARYEESIGEWKLEAKKVEIQNFKFIRLKKVLKIDSESLQRFRFLTIKQLQLEYLTGFLGERDSWRGEGNLSFTNTHRKDNPLFAIPAELILRLGLDPHIMTPVTGTIYFEIRDERFYLKGLKEMYSYARGSKFYLSNEKTISWIDMNGMLSLRIKMRQYNLILKLIEPFIISIQGSLLNPQYQFEKQNKILKKKNKA